MRKLSNFTTLIAIPFIAACGGGNLEFARWIDVTISATTGVQGTEFEQTTSFQLPISAADVEDCFTQPPGLISPYGRQATCQAPDP